MILKKLKEKILLAQKLKKFKDTVYGMPRDPCMKLDKPAKTRKVSHERKNFVFKRLGQKVKFTLVSIVVNFMKSIKDIFVLTKLFV